MTEALPSRAILVPRLFTGDEFLDRQALLIGDGRVAEIVPWDAVPAGLEAEKLPPGAIVAPGLIDVQVNGGGGVLFNDEPNVSGLRRIAAAHRRFGTTAFLPTLITDARRRMREAMAAVRAAVDDGVPGVVGLHLEGPFINPERKGVHRSDMIVDMTEADVAALTEPFPGPLVVTLAPERVAPDLLRRLVKAGILVSIGHSAATFGEAKEAVRRGARGFTHLFNAMSPLTSREPGVVGAALDCPDAFAGLIVDGHHVHPAALRVALAAKGADRLMLVTDAMSSIGSDLEEFRIQDRTIRVSGGRLATEDGTLAGAHLDMASAVRNAVKLLSVPLERALRMASAAPAAFLGLERTHGKLLPGYRADAVALTPELQVIATWIGGERG